MPLDNHGTQQYVYPLPSVRIAIFDMDALELIPDVLRQLFSTIPEAKSDMESPVADDILGTESPNLD